MAIFRMNVGNADDISSFETTEDLFNWDPAERLPGPGDVVSGPLNMTGGTLDVFALVNASIVTGGTVNADSADSILAGQGGNAVSITISGEVEQSVSAQGVAFVTAGAIKDSATASGSATIICGGDIGGTTAAAENAKISANGKLTGSVIATAQIDAASIDMIGNDTFLFIGEGGSVSVGGVSFADDTGSDTTIDAGTLTVSGNFNANTNSISANLIEITNGGIFNVGGALLGSYAMTIRGKDTSFAYAPALTIGEKNFGNIEIREGGSALLGNVRVAGQTGADAGLFLYDTGSRAVLNSLVLGVGGNGDLNSDGGSLTINGLLTTAEQAGSSALLQILGGSDVSVGRIDFGAGMTDLQMFDEDTSLNIDTGKIVLDGRTDNQIRIFGGASLEAVLCPLIMSGDSTFRLLGTEGVFAGIGSAATFESLSMKEDTTFQVRSGSEADITGTVLLEGGTISIGGKSEDGKNAVLTAEDMVIGDLSEGARQDDCGVWEYDPVTVGRVSLSSGGSLHVLEKLTLAGGAEFNSMSLTLGGSISVGSSEAAPGQLLVDAVGILQGHGSIFATTIRSDGWIIAQNGLLTLDGTISGIGILQIDHGSTLDINDACSADVWFGDRDNEQLRYESVLNLDDPLNFEGTIRGLDVGDTISLSAAALKSWSGFDAPLVSNVEIKGGALEVSLIEFGTREIFVGSLDIGGDLSDKVFTLREMPQGAVNLSLLDKSDQINVHTPGRPSGNPYVDSLIGGYASWNPGAGPITYYFGGAGTLHDAVDGHGSIVQLSCESTVRGWSASEILAFQRALNTISSACGISFKQAASVESANLVWWQSSDFLGQVGATGYSELPSTVTSGALWQVFDDRYWTAKNLSFGGFGLGTIIHELGHALGLVHPHDGGLQSDWSVFPGVSLGAAEDLGTNGQNQSIFTTMSYVRGWNGQTPFEAPIDYGNQGGLGAFDIAALQQLYGANQSTRGGNDIYWLPAANQVGTGWSSLWDSGGFDTIINPTATQSTIDLRPAPLMGSHAGGFVSHVDDIVGGFTIAANALIENATGGGGTDLLIGNAIANILDGRGGADITKGVQGDDIYIVNNIGDVVDESFAGSNGVDTIKSAVSRSLADVAHVRGLVENLYLTGLQNINATGNALVNSLVGNSGSNRLDGRAGADRLEGKSGNDIYIVDHIGDTVIELLSGGKDLVQSSVTEALGFGVENLMLTGTSPINGTGNALANSIIGNSGANDLNGLQGSDTLAGGVGADRIVFNSRPDDDTNMDLILGFNPTADTIILQNSIFLGLRAGVLGVRAFVEATSAQDASDRIVYDGISGAVYFDIDGTGTKSAIQFAQVGKGLGLTNADFLVV